MGHHGLLQGQLYAFYLLIRANIKRLLQSEFSESETFPDNEEWRRVGCYAAWLL
jgi:hypothetical protein